METASYARSVQETCTKVLWTDWRQLNEALLCLTMSEPRMAEEVRENQPCNSTIT
jgi:hypothetical protein